MKGDYGLREGERESEVRKTNTDYNTRKRNVRWTEKREEIYGEGRDEKERRDGWKSEREQYGKYSILMQDMKREGEKKKKKLRYRKRQVKICGNKKRMW